MAQEVNLVNAAHRDFQAKQDYRDHQVMMAYRDNLALMDRPVIQDVRDLPDLKDQKENQAFLEFLVDTAHVDQTDRRVERGLLVNLVTLVVRYDDYNIYSVPYSTIKGCSGVGMIGRNDGHDDAREDLFTRALFEVMQDSSVWDKVYNIAKQHTNAGLFDGKIVR